MNTVFIQQNPDSGKFEVKVASQNDTRVVLLEKSISDNVDFQLNGEDMIAHTAIAREDNSEAKKIANAMGEGYLADPKSDVYATEELEIRTDLFKPNPERPGYLLHDRRLTFKELREQLTKCLKNIIMPGFTCSAFDAAEWISPNRDLKEDGVLPTGGIEIRAKHGSNEGYHIEIDMVNRDGYNGTVINLFTIKYLGGKKEVRDVEELLSDAVYEGLFN